MFAKIIFRFYCFCNPSGCFSSFACWEKQKVSFSPGPWYLLASNSVLLNSFHPSRSPPTFCSYLLALISFLYQKKLYCLLYFLGFTIAFFFLLLLLIFLAFVLSGSFSNLNFPGNINPQVLSFPFPFGWDYYFVNMFTAESSGMMLLYFLFYVTFWLLKTKSQIKIFQILVIFFKSFVQSLMHL